MSMLWIYMLANIIVDLLTLCEIVTGVSVALLGLTVLSWGNSIGDTFASVAISRKGYGEMAITGCIAGPIFIMLMGIGMTTMNCNMLLKDGIKYDNFEYDTQFILTVFTLSTSILSICLMIWLVVTNNYKVTRWHGHVLLWSYCVIVALMVYLSRG